MVGSFYVDKFEVKVYDDVEQVGEAEHERFVIDEDQYVERLRKKLEPQRQGEKQEQLNRQDAKGIKNQY